MDSNAGSAVLAGEQRTLRGRFLPAFLRHPLVVFLARRVVRTVVRAETGSRAGPLGCWFLGHRSRADRYEPPDRGQLGRQVSTENIAWPTVLATRWLQGGSTPWTAVA